MRSTHISEIRQVPKVGDKLFSSESVHGVKALIIKYLQIFVYGF